MISPLDKLKALAHEVRFDLLCLLAQREFCVCELEGLLGLNQSKVSYHLGILKDAGFIVGEQRGKNSFYRLERPELYALGGQILTEVLHRHDLLGPTHQTDSVC